MQRDSGFSSERLVEFSEFADLRNTAIACVREHAVYRDLGCDPCDERAGIAHKAPSDEVERRGVAAT